MNNAFVKPHNFTPSVFTGTSLRNVGQSSKGSKMSFQCCCCCCFVLFFFFFFFFFAVVVYLKYSLFGPFFPQFLL